jgi:hypothetical protein
MITWWLQYLDSTELSQPESVGQYLTRMLAELVAENLVDNSMFSWDDELKKLQVQGTSIPPDFEEILSPIKTYLTNREFVVFASTVTTTVTRGGMHYYLIHRGGLVRTNGMRLVQKLINELDDLLVLSDISTPIGPSP